MANFTVADMMFYCMLDSSSWCEEQEISNVSIQSGLSSGQPHMPRFLFYRTPACI